jgi:hypothetical protein
MSVCGSKYQEDKIEESGRVDGTVKDQRELKPKERNKEDEGLLRCRN